MVKTIKPIKEIKLVCQIDGHNKFWRGELYEDKVITFWGKIDTEPSSKEFPGMGEDFLNKKYREKIKKGYVPA
jgi:predicted DNA-binding WGR domain protein